MPTLTFDGVEYTVDHAVKGADYVHGYDEKGVILIAIEGCSSFEDVAYSGVYMEPGACLNESCNGVRYVGGALKTVNGEDVPVSMGDHTHTPEDVGAVPATRKINERELSEDVVLIPEDIGAVNKTGDTMTGNLNIEKNDIVTLGLMNKNTDDRTLILAHSNGSASIASETVDGAKTNRFLVENVEITLKNSVNFQTTRDGTVTTYKMYGEHNVTKGTTALTADSSALDTGCIYLQYE